MKTHQTRITWNQLEVVIASLMIIALFPFPGRSRESLQKPDPPPTIITGKVEIGGKPASGITIRLRPIMTEEVRGAYVVRTEKNGAYAIEEITAGHYQLACQLLPGVTCEREITVLPGTPQQQNIQVHTGTSVIQGNFDSTSYPAPIRTRVTAHSLSNEPAVQGIQFTTLVREKGRFKIGPLPHGNYLLKATLRRKANEMGKDPRPDTEDRPARLKVELQKNETKDISLRPRLGEVTLRVVPRVKKKPTVEHEEFGHKHEPKTVGWSIKLYRKTDTEEVREEDLITSAVDSGEWPRVIRNLPEGPYRIFVEPRVRGKDTPPPANATVTLRKGEMQDVHVRDESTSIEIHLRKKPKKPTSPKE